MSPILKSVPILKSLVHGDDMLPREVSQNDLMLFRWFLQIYDFLDFQRFFDFLLILWFQLISQLKILVLNHAPMKILIN